VGVLSKTFGLGAILDFQSRRGTEKLTEMQKAAQGLRLGLQDVGGTLRTTAGTVTKFALALAPLGAAIGLGVRNAMRWEEGMARIGTLLAGPDLARLPKLSADMDRLTTSFGLGADTVQEGMFQAISASVPFAKSTDFMKVAAQAAVGGFTEMNVAVDGLTNVLNAYGLDASEAARVSDAFFVANKRGKTTFGELAASLGKVTSTARPLGVTYQDLSAAIATVSKTGIVTQEVVTGLKAAFTNLIKPTADAEKEAQRLGIALGPEAIKAAGGFVPFMQMLAAKTKGNVGSMSALFGSVEALNTVLAMTSESGIKDLAEGLAEIQGQSGQTAAAFRLVEQTGAFQMRQTGAILTSLGRRIGDAFVPVIRDIGRIGSQVSAWLDANKPRVDAFVRTVGQYARDAFDAAKSGLGWVVQHGETLLAIAKQLLSTWLKIKAAQLAIGGARAVVGLGRVLAQGPGGILAALLGGGGAAEQAAGGLKALGQATTEAAAQTRKLFGFGPTVAMGKAGTLFGPLTLGVSKLATGFSFAGAALAGWEIGQWLNSFGADELVAGLLRKMFGGGGPSPRERDDLVKRQEASSLAAQRALRLGGVLGYSLGFAPEALGQNTATVQPHVTQVVAAARTIMGQGVQSDMQSVGERLANEMFGGISPRQAQDVEAVLRDVAKGGYGKNIWGFTEADADAFAEAIRPLLNVSVSPDVSVNVDGREIARATGRQAAQDNARGVHEGRLYSPAERTRILRSGVAVIPAGAY